MADKIISFDKREKISEGTECNYCHLYIDGKCSIGHKSVKKNEVCEDLVPID